MIDRASTSIGLFSIGVHCFVKTICDAINRLLFTFDSCANSNYDKMLIDIVYDIVNIDVQDIWECSRDDHQ
jgi:hypothetical protein